MHNLDPAVYRMQEDSEAHDSTLLWPPFYPFFESFSFLTGGEWDARELVKSNYSPNACPEFINWAYK